ncbi:Rne/Rng family ribonuclease [Thermosynechococcaceae cyanobacterium BACA0444]|uniref:Rne/Rng family ribonuclease n=1 Tax=Pseudocalidococcus azoricus BACA0444 TaxID=2918990 RepID=A0AAE4K052_9CYAN|nr:Rne/Rng family ribonuclease [Pseudocalidococcus azoricus BACA0444]
MSKQIIIAEQHRLAAVISEDQIQELIVASGSYQISDVYLGIVENVLPGIDAAFINLGDATQNGFIHVTDLGPLRLRRSAGAITELLTPQQKVLVQVMKEPTGNKGPRLTGNISLPGRYLVLMPFGRGVNLSRRILSEAERHRLRALAILVKPAGMGLLVRTEAEGVAEEAILEDLEALQRQWETIQQQAQSTRAPALLGRDDDFVQRVLRDVYSSDVNRIVVDVPESVKRVKQNLMAWNESKLPVGVLIDYHQEAIPILDYFRVNAAIREALKPRVDLPSGGYVIIEPTEALTVIDVNSGSFTRSATARETVLWTNCEAATEIARQLKLRNLAGVIIVDFIDMDTRRDQLQLLEHFSKALRADKARPQIAQLSELGLVELTRKRQGQNIYELFGRPCRSCGGLGHLVHLPGHPDDSPGEIVERVIPPRIIETRARPLDVPNRPEVASGNGIELQLTNHPGYQEVSSSRRRSTRPRVGNGISAPPGQAPTPSRSLPRRSRPDSTPPLNVTATVAKTARTEAGPTTTSRIVLPETPRSETGSRPSRKPTPRPRTIEPPEHINVTMTTVEQDVYALMGISPLVLYTGEVKSPRNTVVSVAAPGQAPVPPPAISRAAIPSQRGEEPASGYAPEPEVASQEFDDAVNSPLESLSVLEPAVINPAVLDVMLPQALETESALIIETSLESETPESLAVGVRRRRRRTTGGDEQLSFGTEIR